MALRLKRNGVARVRPLHGGLGLWVERQFPLDDLKVSGVATAPTSPP